MKIAVTPPKDIKCSTQDMRFGQVAVVTTPGIYCGETLLRSSGGFVNLGAPNQMLGGNTDLSVCILPVGTQITLTLEV